MINIGEKVKALREKNYFSQRELSRRMGCTSAAISVIEKGGRMPSASLLKKFSDVFNISLEDLLNVEKPKEKSKVDSFYIKWKFLDSLNEKDRDIVYLLGMRLKSYER